MLSQAVRIEYIVTQSESDALILENSFIKQLKPKYNILLRDDKTYPYIYIDLNDNFPRFEMTRKILKGNKIRYFGPYFRGSKEILEALYSEFKLVQKKSCIKSAKACMFYQIKRCSAPCEGKISQKDYEQIVKKAIKFLQNPELLLPNLQSLMARHATSQNYEEAARIRDIIRVIKDIKIKVEVDLARLEDFEAIAISCDKNLICEVRFSVRDGKISSSHSSISNQKLLSKEDLGEAYKQVILEAFPADSPIPSTKIYIHDDFEDKELITQILSLRHNKKFSIIHPKMGDKRKIVAIAHQNGEILIKKHLKTYDYAFLNELKEYFELENLPVEIEAFDNSHLFGQAAVGAMVSYGIDGFKKEFYRHIYLKDKNDYDQMCELLTSRAKRFEKISPPDLWIIDGGKALLDLAQDIINSTGANIDIIAISKEKIDSKAHRAKSGARDKIHTKNGIFSLNLDDKKLQFFQKLRDEAHRFALSFHKKSKQKQDLQSSKLRHLGISAGSIKKLLDYYGDFEKIYSATYEEIRNLTNKSVADKIFANSK